MPSLHKPSPTPTSIKPSPTELKNEKLESRNLEIAVCQIHLDGLVVVEDVIPHAEIDHLNEKMVEDAKILLEMKEKGPFNYNQGNLQQDAPPVAEFFHPAIFMSKLLPFSLVF